VRFSPDHVPRADAAADKLIASGIGSFPPRSRHGTARASPNPRRIFRQAAVKDPKSGGVLLARHRPFHQMLQLEQSQPKPNATPAAEAADAGPFTHSNRVALDPDHAESHACWARSTA
jgi:hypothetical protein